MSDLPSSPNRVVFSPAPVLLASLVLALIASVSANAQGGQGYAFHPNQEVRVRGLSSSSAPSSNASAVLAAALEIVLHHKAVCCGKNSALEDIVLSAPPSLRELSSKLQGAHILSDGRSVMVNADYVSQGATTPDLIISLLLDQHAPLLDWKSHVYVLYGAVFDETRYDDGRRQYGIKRLLLRDPRFSDQRGEVVFNRETDNWGDVQGLLTVSAARQ